MVADAKGFFADEGSGTASWTAALARTRSRLWAPARRLRHHGRRQHVFQARLAPDPVDVIAVGTLLQLGPYSYITLANPGDRSRAEGPGG